MTYSILNYSQQQSNLLATLQIKNGPEKRRLNPFMEKDLFLLGHAQEDCTEIQVILHSLPS